MSYASRYCLMPKYPSFFKAGINASKSVLSKSSFSFIHLTFKIYCKGSARVCKKMAQLKNIFEGYDIFIKRFIRCVEISQDMSHHKDIRTSESVESHYIDNQTMHISIPRWNLWFELKKHQIAP